MTTDELRKALKQAFHLGQTYWQQADSDYTSQWKKADQTRATFDALVDEACVQLAAPQPKAEPVAWINWSALTGEPRLGWGCESEIASEPLYKAPQPRKRLTDEEIDVLWAKQQTKPFKTHAEDRMQFARAIEAAVWGDGK